tara:strand:+ start:793 stop:1524 length:732 start_codon:yes stop_codon:yes gene_type:complete
MDINSKKDKVILTGANGQIGRAIAEKLNNYYEVINIDINYKQDDIDSNHINLDISSLEKVTALFNAVNPSVLINNAGISVFTDFTERTTKELDSVYDVNLKGTINMINEFARINKENEKPKSIVNIASLYGIVSADPRIYTDLARNSPEIYAATKAGVIQLTKYYCVHLRNYNIRVNAISPGGIFNPYEPQGEDFIKNYSARCPMGRMGDAGEIANGVSFLASDESSYINGHNLVIDGGFSAW